MIRGITDKIRYPRLGKIRLGEKVAGQGGREYPKALDRFVFVDAEPVAKVLGENCRRLAPVLFPTNPVAVKGTWDFSMFWKTSRSAYGRGTGLFCRCTDGDTAHRVHKGIVNDPNRPQRHGKPADAHGYAFLQEQKKLEGTDAVDVGEIYEIPCTDECPYWKNELCKNLGVLDFLLPTVPGFGVWTIQTSSFNSIRNIESTLQMLAHATGGVVAGIPCAINLVPHLAQVNGAAKTVHVLELLVPHNLQQLAGLRRKALAAGGVLAAIEGPEPVPDDLVKQGGAALDVTLGEDAEVVLGPLDPVDELRETAQELAGALGLPAGEAEYKIRQAEAASCLPELCEEWREAIQVREDLARQDRIEVFETGPVKIPEKPAPEKKPEKPGKPSPKQQQGAAVARASAENRGPAPEPPGKGLLDF